MLSLKAASSFVLRADCEKESEEDRTKKSKKYGILVRVFMET
jgi:hypothetical protein